MTRSLIVCCAPGFAEGWQKLGPGLTGDEALWVFYDDRPIYFWEKVVRRPNLAMVRACLQAVIRASRGDARLLITHDPRVSFWCALFCTLLRIQVDHYVDSFNFSDLPVGIRRRFMRSAFRQVKEFAVHSTMERSLYSRYFDIPEDRIRLRLWSIGVPEVSPEQPLQKGRYVSSIGGNGRDYRTLLEASRVLCDIPFVLVVRPESLTGLKIPPNVRVLVNAPFGEAMNVLLHSEFTVLPLAGSTVPCGHVTLVCAMHLARTAVATDSTGISDYLRHGYNGVLCEPSSPESLALAISNLWSNPAEIVRLSENNKQFGYENCSEAKIRSDLAAVLDMWKIPLRHELILTKGSTNDRRSIDAVSLVEVPQD
ncbi:MAG: glycosyltransferase [Terracidiphilus sp.]|jgi:glycosyltransferase involved in cell wall biosynthesis